MNYSQSREQEHILNYFKDYERVTFCSIGENDGETLSNVRALALTGKACGILIEPSPRAFQRLKKLYEGSTKGCFYIYDFAIGNKNGKLRFWESDTHLNKGDVGLLSTADEKELKRFPGTKYEEIEVKVYRWKTALNRFSIKQFDLISLDAEGLCLDIVKQMDLTETKMIVIEWNCDQKLKQEYDKIMEGFKIIYTSGENLIYAR